MRPSKRVDRISLYIAFCIIIFLMLLSAEEVNGKKKRRSKKRDILHGLESNNTICEEKPTARGLSRKTWRKIISTSSTEDAKLNETTPSSSSTTTRREHGNTERVADEERNEEKSVISPFEERETDEQRKHIKSKEGTTEEPKMLKNVEGMKSPFEEESADGNGKKSARKLLRELKSVTTTTTSSSSTNTTVEPNEDEKRQQIREPKRKHKKPKKSKIQPKVMPEEGHNITISGLADVGKLEKKDDIYNTSKKLEEFREEKSEKSEISKNSEKSKELRDPPAGNEHQNMSNTLPPGIEPAAPAFNSEEDLFKQSTQNNTSATTTPTTENTENLEKNFLATDFGDPKEMANLTAFDAVNLAFLSYDNENGTNSTKYWKFTQLPYDNRTDESNNAVTEPAEPRKAKMIDEMDKAKEESEDQKVHEQDSHKMEHDHDKISPHLGQHQIFADVPSDGGRTESNNSSSSSDDDVGDEVKGHDVANHEQQQRQQHEGGQKWPQHDHLHLHHQQQNHHKSGKRKDAKNDGKQQLQQQENNNTDTAKMADGESIASHEREIAAKSKHLTTEIESGTRVTVATVAPSITVELDLGFELAPTKYNNNNNNNSSPNLKQTVVMMKERKKILSKKKEHNERGSLFFSTTNNNNSSEETTGGRDSIESNEENCCKLLRMLKDKKANNVSSSDRLSREQQLDPSIFSKGDGNERSNKLGTGQEQQQQQEGEGAGEELEADDATVKAHWKIIQSVTTTTKSGLQILKEDLREENVKMIRNHPESQIAPSISPTLATKAPTTYKGLFTRPTTLSYTQKWTPYIFDCALEVDERGEALCQEWAKGGLCEINRATRFLFCRKTCLCVGILEEKTIS